jgi:hypothetical protein
MRYIQIGGLLAFATVLVSLLTASTQTGDGTKQALPTAAEEDKASKLLRKLFADEFARAVKSVADRKELAVTLRGQARDTKDSPALQYTALKQAALLAATAGDTALAFEIVADIAAAFQVDAAAVKVDVLAHAGQTAAEVEVHHAVADVALTLLEEAIEKDDFSNGVRLAAIAQASAAKTTDKKLQSRVQSVETQVADLKKQYDALKPNLDMLAKNPKDAEANLVVGKYFCLAKGKWEKGLPYLAMGGDEGLKKLAKRDLANPEKVGEQLALGDAWWGLAENEKDQTQKNLRRRAIHWYTLAYPALTGDNKARVEQHFKVAGSEVPTPFVPAGHVRTFNGHTKGVQSAAISPDNKYIVSGGDDDDLRLWELATGKELKTFKGHTQPVWSVAFSPDGKFILSGGEDDIVRLWDVEKGVEIKQLRGHTDIINRVIFSPDGKKAVSTADDKTARLWDLENGQEIRKFEGHIKPVWGAIFSKDGNMLITTGSDNVAIVWDVKTGKELKRFSEHTDNVLSVAISPDAKYAVTAGSDSVPRMWEVETGKEVRKFEGHTGSVFSVAFTPDGKRIVTSGADKTIRVWDAKTGKQLERFEGHTDDAVSVAVSGDGRYAVSASLDMTVRLWGLPK